MRKKVILGCILFSTLILLAMFPSVVCFQTVRIKENINNEINNAFQNLKGTTDGWHLGFFIELIIGTIFILLILLGILVPED